MEQSIAIYLVLQEPMLKIVNCSIVDLNLCNKAVGTTFSVSKLETASSNRIVTHFVLSNNRGSNVDSRNTNE